MRKSWKGSTSRAYNLKFDALFVSNIFCNSDIPKMIFKKFMRHIKEFCFLFDTIKKKKKKIKNCQNKPHLWNIRMFQLRTKTSDLECYFGLQQNIFLFSIFNKHMSQKQIMCKYLFNFIFVCSKFVADLEKLYFLELNLKFDPCPWTGKNVMNTEQNLLFFTF